MLTDEQVTAIMGWLENGDRCVQDDDGRHHYRVTLPEELYTVLVAHMRTIGAARKVIDESREWLRYLDEDRQGRYFDGIPGELMDAIDRYDGVTDE